MFQLRIAKQNEQPTDLQEEITRVHAHLKTLEPDSPKYAAAADQLVKLEKLKDETTTSKRRPSPDALVAAGASVLGVLLIVTYEHAHVMTSKATQFIHKAAH